MKRDHCLIIVGLIVLASSPACKYENRPTPGAMVCGSGAKTCPDGYSCYRGSVGSNCTNTCWPGSSEPAPATLCAHGGVLTDNTDHPDAGTGGVDGHLEAPASVDGVDARDASDAPRDFGGTGGQGGDAGGVEDSRRDGPEDLAITSPDGSPDIGTRTCDAGTHSCSGACFPNDTEHCGALCEKCIAPAGGTATCDGTQCGLDCGSLKKCNSKCVTGCCVDTDCPVQGGKTGQCDTSTNTCTYQTCAASFKPCGILCIGVDKCCGANDCTGVCTTCSGAGGTCVTVKSQDDLDSCAGTCDANGACKSKQGQTCQTTAGGCVTGTTCAPDGYCCNTACSRSCEACDISGFLGTCTPVASGMPHGNRSGCGNDVTCRGQCSGRTDALCNYPIGSCGGGSTCSGVSVVDQGMCGNGACVTPAAHACTGGFTCVGNGCRVACSADTDCLPDYFCRGGLCHRDAKGVAIGFSHVCVLLVDGGVRCWGMNQVGQLGNGTTTPSSLPVVVTGIQGATAITAADYYNLVLMPDGTVRHWGLLSSGTGITISNVSTPARLTNINTATSVSSSGNAFRNCVVLSDGTVRCWGYNNGALGALGSGDTSTNFSDTPVTVANLTGVTAVSTGSTFSCALLQASAWCWGDNSTGQLGDGSIINSPVPVLVSGLPGSVATIAASKDGAHVCTALRDSTVSCWGFNGSGQLGNGTTAFPRTANPPAPVTGLSGATALALGANHSCALLTGGDVKCWGANESGELGNGLTTDAASPQPVNLGGSAISIAAGTSSTCAVLSNGAVVCWGLGTQVGYPVNALTPTPSPDW